MAAIFISHSSADNAAAREIAQSLETAGFTSLFLDIDTENGIAAGAEWEQTLYARLRQCHAVVAVLTPNWLASKWCFAEIVQAREKGKALFPIICQPCDMPAVLADFQAVDLNQERDAGYARLIAGLKARGLDPSDIFDWDPTRAPYPGMMAFQEDQAAIFFGRGEETLALQESLDGLRRQQHAATQLAVVLGASGSGKSSLVRAGLLPRLRKEPQRWLVLRPMRPQSDPLEQLASSLAAAFATHDAHGDRAAISERLQSDPANAIAEFADALRAAAGTPDATVLLVVDQAEELLGERASQATRKFIEALTETLAANEQLMALLTLRSDFLGEFQAAIPAAAPTLARAYLPLPLQPMPVERFVEIIRAPAKLAGIVVEDRLVERLVADASTSDALPLLAFSLRRLYDRFGTQNRAITSDDYDKLGKLDGAVREEAERLLATLQPTEDEMAALRAAFVPKMVRIESSGAFARRTAQADTMPPAAQKVLDALVASYLLVKDRDHRGRDTIEIAHEALLRVWPLLAGWLEEDRDRLRLLATVTRDASEWHAAREPQELLLHRGVRLADAARVLADPRFARPADGIESRYLHGCRTSEEAAARREQRRRQWLFGGVAGFALIFAALATVALLQGREAARQRDAALTAESLRLADLAQAELAAGNVETSIHLARRALAGAAPDARPPYNYDAAAALVSALQEYRASTATVQAAAELHLSFLDEDRLLGAGRGAWWIADANSGELLSTHHHTGEYAFARTASGRFGLTVGYETLLWDLEQGTVRATLRQDEPRVAYSGDVGPNGRFVVTAEEDGFVRSWEIADDAALVLRDVGKVSTRDWDKVWQARFSPDMSRLVVFGENDLVIWTYADGQLGEELMREPVESTGPNNESLHFLGDSSLVYIDDRDPRIVDTRTGTIVLSFDPAARDAATSVLAQQLTRRDAVTQMYGIDEEIVQALREAGHADLAAHYDGMGGWPTLVKPGLAYVTDEAEKHLRHPNSVRAVIEPTRSRAATGGLSRTHVWNLEYPQLQAAFVPTTTASLDCFGEVVDTLCAVSDTLVITAAPYRRNNRDVCVWNAHTSELLATERTSRVLGAEYRFEFRGHYGITSLGAWNLRESRWLNEPPNLKDLPEEDTRDSGPVLIDGDEVTVPIGSGLSSARHRVPGVAAASAASPDGAYGATHTDSTVQLWRMADGQLAEVLTAPQVPRCTGFLPDGTFRFVTEFGVMYTWPEKGFSSTESLIEHAARVAPGELSSRQKRAFGIAQ